MNNKSSRRWLSSVVMFVVLIAGVAILGIQSMNASTASIPQVPENSTRVVAPINNTKPVATHSSDESLTITMNGWQETASAATKKSGGVP